MKRKLTVKLALQQCLKLWTWLAEHPDKDKDDWPGWKKISRNGYVFDCPCCEFVTQQVAILNIEGNDMECATEDSPGPFRQWIKLCPLKKLWPKGCCAFGSPFDTWVRHGSAFPTTRIRTAIRIAKACERELERLNKQKQQQKG